MLHKIPYYVPTAMLSLLVMMARAEQKPDDIAPSQEEEIPLAIKPAVPPFRLMSKEREAKLRALLPVTNDSSLKSLYSAGLVFYTDKEMPKAYQHDGGFHDVFYNISATKPVEPFGNVNREFPWAHPFGTHECVQDNLFTFRFMYLPPGKKISWVYQDMPRTDTVILPTYKALKWEYPKDTVFAEVLCQWDPDKESWVAYEVRTRRKPSDTAKHWIINVFRPMLTRDEFDDWIGKHDKSAPDLTQNLTLGRLKNRHPKMIVDRVAVEDELPAISHESVRKILKLPFRSALGQAWTTGIGEETGKTYECHAPTTKDDFHLIPKNYKAGYIEVSSKSCMACHQDTLTLSFTFERQRDWYGRLRGSDGIISFHIVEPDCISGDGFVRQIYLRKELTNAGILVERD